MERLINIDNGGTLTDIVVGSGTDFTFTKTLTTPVDLSQCLFDGITKASTQLYGEPNLAKLLHIDEKMLQPFRTMGQNGKQYIHDHYRWNTILTKYPSAKEREATLQQKAQRHSPMF